MFQTQPTQPTPPTVTEAWLAWRRDTPAEADNLSIAELAECRCPDLCDRDHANE